MPPFHVMFRWTVSVVCFCLILQRSGCQETVNNSSEHVLPTPLILYLNESTAQMLIEQANNIFVSNTSINDIISNNETQQMMIKYRERKRQARILTIQRDILRKLGLTEGPNVTARLSAEERESLVRSFDRTMMEQVRSEADTNETLCADSNSPC